MPWPCSVVLVGIRTVYGFGQRHFVSVAIDPHHGDYRREDGLLVYFFLGRVAEHFDLELHTGLPFSLQCRFKSQNSALPDTLFKLDVVDGNRDKVHAGKVHRGRDPGYFVHPFQKVPTEKKPVVIQIARHHQFVGLHAYLSSHWGQPKSRRAPTLTNSMI